MASKNDITLDVIYNRPTEQFRKNLENVDFSVKLTDEPANDADEDPIVYRYAEVGLDKQTIVLMPFYHESHNLMLNFDRKTGKLLSAYALQPGEKVN